LKTRADSSEKQRDDWEIVVSPRAGVVTTLPTNLVSSGIFST
jgi:hypothetical protein